jgi:hypothetical protein
VSHGAEENGVRGRRRTEGFFGKRDPDLLIKLGPCLVRLEPKANLARVRRHRIEERQAWRHHLAADAIAGKHRNLKVMHE